MNESHNHHLRPVQDHESADDYPAAERPPARGPMGPYDPTVTDLRAAVAVREIRRIMAEGAKAAQENPDPETHRERRVARWAIAAGLLLLAVSTIAAWLT